MRFFVIIYRYKNGYRAMAPDLPDCVADAKTIEGVRKLMAKTMALHIDAIKRDGKKIPKPRKRVQLDVDEFEGDEFCTWIQVKTRKAV